MKFHLGLLACGLAIGFAGCGAQHQTQEPTNNVEAPILPAPSAPPAVSNRESPAPSSLPEPKGPIDPKSVEAAGQVVQHYGALIEQNRFAEAARFWSDGAAAAAFAKSLPTSAHLTIGDLGATEGAAGSIYTTVPATFYGSRFSKKAEIVLRRVNDVPGSTAAQRRWHIERIDWKAG